jgi:G3E family GTPase
MGHPRNILKTLASKEYKGVLDLRACLCLIDPRHLSDQRYLDSELFMDQISVADVLVANKTDQCSPADQQRFNDFTDSMGNAIQASGWVTQGKLDPAWMELAHTPANHPVWKKIRQSASSNLLSFSMPLADDVILDIEKLQIFIDSLEVERLKAIVNTDQGVVFINHVNGETSVSPVNDSDSYRVEIISSQVIDEAVINKSLDLCKR